MPNVTDGTETHTKIYELMNVLTLYGEQAIHTIDT